MPDYLASAPEQSARVPPAAGHWKNRALLFAASFAALYFELAVIRYLATQIRVFAYVQNLPLIASFLGLGAGMVIDRPMHWLKRAFPFLSLTLFLLIAYSKFLDITRIPFGGRSLFVWDQGASQLPQAIQVLRFMAVTLGITTLVVAFFIVLGRILGECLVQHRPLVGYGLNLSGSLAGIAAFTLISFLRLPPAVWIFVGFITVLPFFLRNRLALICFAATLVAIPWPSPYTFWSPYYRIHVTPVAPPAGWPRPAAYLITADHDYHQKIVNLSSSFMRRFPNAEPNRAAQLTYNLPYEFVAHPGRVLIVGAGTGNDVAAAERHGAKWIDAVEIDPVIQWIGAKLHPEHPYSSPLVHVHINDARAFFEQAPKGSYDLVEFAYLDSHTLFASMSSLRLDNYVYTLESLEEAKSLLRPGGYLVLAFDAGRSFVTDRLFATLGRAFGEHPLAFQVGYDKAGVVLVERLGEPPANITGIPEITGQLAIAKVPLISTDNWPFLYLRFKKIPEPILFVLIPFLIGAYILLRDSGSLPRLRTPWSVHLFLLGSGFLLLETRAITDLALLFGSTWIVNAVVISSFLLMALLANTLVIYLPIPRKISYLLLFISLLVSVYFPYGHLNTFQGWTKILSAGLLFATPVFLSGMVFSRSFRDAGAPSEALGANLLGAVVGGVLENSVTIAGTAFLGYLAVVLYAGSALALLLHRRTAQQSVPAMDLAD